eukprot:sb/3478392/
MIPGLHAAYVEFNSGISAVKVLREAEEGQGFSIGGFKLFVKEYDPIQRVNGPPIDTIEFDPAYRCFCNVFPQQQEKKPANSSSKPAEKCKGGGQQGGNNQS